MIQYLVFFLHFLLFIFDTGIENMVHWKKKWGSLLFVSAQMNTDRGSEIPWTSMNIKLEQMKLKN